jgi:hypothetical protein
MGHLQSSRQAMVDILWQERHGVLALAVLISGFSNWTAMGQFHSTLQAALL